MCITHSSNVSSVYNVARCCPLFSLPVSDRAPARTLRHGGDGRARNEQPPTILALLQVCPTAQMAIRHSWRGLRVQGPLCMTIVLTILTHASGDGGPHQRVAVDAAAGITTMEPDPHDEAPSANALPASQQPSSRPSSLPWQERLREAVDLSDFPKLVELTRKGVDGQKGMAAAALASLATKAESQVAIAKAGGIEPLVALARSGQSAETQFLGTYARGALSNLAVNAANKKAIVAAGGAFALEGVISNMRD